MVPGAPQSHTLDQWLQCYLKDDAIDVGAYRIPVQLTLPQIIYFLDYS